MKDMSSMVIYVTREYGSPEDAAIAICEYLKRFGIDFYRQSRDVVADGGTGDVIVAVCDCISVDGLIERYRMSRMLNEHNIRQRFYVEIWEDLCKLDRAEHVCYGSSYGRCFPENLEYYHISEHPEITPEYLSEDYAVAFLNDLNEGKVYDTCSLYRRKW